MSELLPTGVTPAEVARRRNATLWADEANWSAFLYFCKADSRLWVPKRRSRISWGWTLNFAHPSAPWILLFLLVGIPLIQAGAIGIAAQYANACKSPGK